jgi:hypothetical protein
MLSFWEYQHGYRQHQSTFQHHPSAKIDCPLFDVLFGALCAVIAGARGWTDIREYVLGHQNEYGHIWPN